MKGIPFVNRRYTKGTFSVKNGIQNVKWLDLGAERPHIKLS